MPSGIGMLQTEMEPNPTATGSWEMCISDFTVDIDS